MDQVTQQNAAMVEESSGATQASSQETQQLNAALARFTIAQAQSFANHARAS
jgi:methyl-accepting chemotaxis protein